jgi:hypothetical protein
LQFIEAVEKRDSRKTKHTGFFVNAGELERIGEKAVKQRKRKAPAATGAAAAPNAVPPAAVSAPSTAAAHQGSDPASTQPAAKAAKTVAVQQPTTQPGSLVQRALIAAAVGAGADAGAANLLSVVCNLGF